MPFIKTEVLTVEHYPVNYDPNSGQTIGQLVDQQLADVIGDMAGHSVPQSISFNFDGPEDFHNFMRSYDPFINDMRPLGKKKARKSIHPTNFNPVSDGVVSFDDE